MIFKKEIKKEKYKAIIELELLPYTERMKLIKKMNFKIDNEGQLVNSGIDQLEDLASITKSQIKSIKVIFGKKEITTIEELEFYEEFSEIMNELFIHVINGVKLGEV